MVYSPGAYFTWLKQYYRPQMLWAPKILPRYKRVGQVWAICWFLPLLLTLRHINIHSACSLMGLPVVIVGFLELISFLILWSGLIALGTRLCSNGSQTVVPGPVAPVFIEKISYSARKALLIFASVYATCNLVRAVYFALSMRNDDPRSFLIIQLAASLCQFLLVIFGTRLVTDIAGMIFSQRQTAHEMAEARFEYSGFDYALEQKSSSKSVLRVSLALLWVFFSGGVIYIQYFLVRQYLGLLAQASLMYPVLIPACLMILRLLCGIRLQFRPIVFVLCYCVVLGLWTCFHLMILLEFQTFSLYQIAHFILGFILGLLACEAASAVCGRPSKS